MEVIQRSNIFKKGWDRTKQVIKGQKQGMFLQIFKL